MKERNKSSHYLFENTLANDYHLTIKENKKQVQGFL